METHQVAAGDTATDYRCTDTARPRIDAGGECKNWASAHAHPSNEEPPIICGMFKLKSLDVFIVQDFTCFVVTSPITSHRSAIAYFSVLGDLVEIDGTVYKPVGLEFYAKGTPIEIGELVSIAVIKGENHVNNL